MNKLTIRCNFIIFIRILIDWMFSFFNDPFFCVRDLGTFVRFDWELLTFLLFCFLMSGNSPPLVGDVWFPGKWRPPQFPWLLTVSWRPLLYYFLHAELWSFVFEMLILRPTFWDSAIYYKNIKICKILTNIFTLRRLFLNWPLFTLLTLTLYKPL